MSTVTPFPSTRPQLRVVRSVNLTDRVAIALDHDIPLYRVVNALNAAGLALGNLPDCSLPVIVRLESAR